MNATHVIVGAGASGFFSAIHLKQKYPSSRVIIIEKSSEILAKVAISGGGRCNVTHACFDPKQLIEHYPRGSKELLGSFYSFNPKHTMDWFQRHGVPLKIEPDGRVFPISDSSQSIIDCLLYTAKKLGIIIWTNCAVTHIQHKANKFHINLINKQTLLSDILILATGSSRKGYEFAHKLGHRIISPIPSLFTFKINDKLLHNLKGLSVSNIHVWLNNYPKQFQSGPVLITHWGLSGPSIIKLSAWEANCLHQKNYNLPITLNWLPDLSCSEISSQLKDVINKNPKKSVSKLSPFNQIPERLWAYLVSKSGISLTITCAEFSLKLQKKLIETVTSSQFIISGKGVFKEEFVTCGGIDLKEVNFKTMQSNYVKGLFFVGEILNIDGITGGFNFQNAWTTGFIAGTQA